MAKKLSTKKPLTGNRRSHALNATKHAQKPNFQKVTINGTKVILTAREARTLKKEEENSSLYKLVPFGTFFIAKKN